jgi:hypothetical protein
MENHKLRANEEFFIKTIEILREGGKYGWPATGHTFTKRCGKLLGSEAALAEVKKIVSGNFFQHYFGILIEKS